MQQHPELFAEFAIGLLAKELAVPVPVLPSFEEQLIRETMRDPDYRADEAERMIESRKAEAERIAESREMDDLFAYLKKINRMARMMGYERGARPGAGPGLDEVMKIVVADGGLTDILQAFNNVRRPPNAAKTPQEFANAEPRPEGLHQAGSETYGGGQWSGPDEQAAEVRSPSPEPQSPAPQEPEVREKPGCGAGPQRVEIGVPADSLGLLGLGGDTSFIDRPLV